MKIKSILLTALILFCLSDSILSQNVPSYVPSNGLVGFWPFNGNANDESGNGNDGAVNGAVLSTDRFGNPNSVYSFNGSSSFIQIQNSSSLSLSNQITISVWFNINNYFLNPVWNNLSFPILCKSNSAGNFGMFNLGIEPNIVYSYLNQQGRGLPVTNINLNQWTHLVTTIQAGIISCYINGILVSSQSCVSQPGGIGSPINSNPLIIGNDIPGQTEWTNGKLDDIGIWNRALSPAEISGLYVGCGLNITTQPSSQTINQNKAAQFVVAASDPAASYQWQTDIGNGFQNIQDQGKFSGTNNDTLLIAGVRICNDNQAFRCIVTSGACADTTSIATLSVNYDETCIDSNATVGDPLAVFTTEKVACSSQLNFNNLSINGILSTWDFGDPASGSDNTSNLSNPSHVFSAAGTYAVTLISKDGPGCSDTLTKNVEVAPLGSAPIANFTAQIDSGACITKVHFTNTSSNATHFIWTFPDGSINKQANPSITFPLAGNYAIQLIAISESGCSDTLTQNIVIQSNSTGAVARFTANDTAQCFANHSFNFNNQSLYFGPSFIQTYIWDFGDGTTNTSNTFVYNKQYAAAGVYTVQLIGISPTGCADTAYQTIRVIPSAQANFTVNIGCSKTATLAHFIEPNTTYIWNFGDGKYASHTLDTFNHTFTRPGFYNITLSAYAENACSSTFNLNTYASDGNTPIANFSYDTVCGNNIQFNNLTQFGSGYLWNFGDGSPVVSEFAPYHSFPTAGTYTVTLTTNKSATCSHTISLPVSAPQGWNIKLPRAKLAYYVHPCTNEISAVDSFSLESVNFKWYLNKVFIDTGSQITVPTGGPGNYEIMLVADNFFCSDTAIAGIKIQEAPEALFEISNDACSNTIIVNNLSKNANTYMWDFGDVSATHNVKTGPSASHTYANNGTYTIRLIAFNLTGCSDTISLPVTLTKATALNKANFTYTYGLCNCECDNYIRFKNLTPGTNTYLWTFGDGSSSVLPDFVKGFPTPGNFKVTLTAVDSVGCMSTQTQTIEIDPAVSGPSASFNTDHQVQCIDKNSFNFYNTSIHMGQGWIKKYYWYFGDGTMDSTNSFISNKKYASAGNYIVTLVAVNAQDCRDTMSMFVQVRPLPCAGVLKFVNLQDGSNWNIDPKLNDAGMVNAISSTDANQWYSMHPNPNNGSFSIQFKERILEPITITVVDVLGKQVYQKTHEQMGSNLLQVGTDNLQDGTYLLLISSEKQQYNKQKFVVIK